jgi:hypothetical protein
MSNNETPLYSNFQCSNIPSSKRAHLFKVMEKYNIKKNYMYCRLSKYSNCVKKTVIFDLDTLLNIREVCIENNKKTKFIDSVIDIYNGTYENVKRKQNLEELAIYLGKTKSFFHQLKTKQYTLFRYLCFIGKGNPAIGYTKFDVAIDKQVDEFCEHMLQFPNRWQASLYLVAKGFYSSGHSAYSQLIKIETVGVNSKQLEWNFFKKLRKMNKHFRRNNECNQ